MKSTLSLKKNNDFQRVLQKGKWYNGKLISIYKEVLNSESFIAPKKSDIK